MCDKILPFQEEEKRANSFSYDSTTFGNSENGFALLKYGLESIPPMDYEAIHTRTNNFEPDFDEHL